MIKMILQLSYIQNVHLFNVVMILVMVIIILFFTVNTLLKYYKYRHKAAFYLTLNYFSYIAALILYIVGHYSVVLTDDLGFHHNVTMVSNFFIVLGIMMATKFYEQFSELKKGYRYTGITVGTLIMVWILLPFNYNVDIATSQIVIITYSLMTFYGIIVYTSLTILFYKQFKLISDNKRGLGALVIGNFLWVVNFGIRIIYGITLSDFLEILANFIMIIIFLCFFLGLFFFPKMKKNE